MRHVHLTNDHISTEIVISKQNYLGVQCIVIDGRVKCPEAQGYPEGIVSMLTNESNAKERRNYLGKVDHWQSKVASWFPSKVTATRSTSLLCTTAPLSRLR